jgi:hypothetical protein
MSKFQRNISPPSSEFKKKPKKETIMNNVTSRAGSALLKFQVLQNT